MRNLQCRLAEVKRSRRRIGIVVDAGISIPVLILPRNRNIFFFLCEFLTKINNPKPVIFIRLQQ